MSFSTERYTGDGVQREYDYTKPYLIQAHVIVTVTDAPQTQNVDYIWISPTRIQFTVAPADGAAILLARNTSQDERLVNFQEPGSLGAPVLNSDSIQAFYMAQEAIDRVADTMGLDATANWDALGLRIRDLGAPVEADDAASKIYVDNAITGSGNVPAPVDTDLFLISTGPSAFTWFNSATALGVIGAEPANADILKADETQNLQVGYTCDVENLGNITVGTVTIDLTDPFHQTLTVGGDFTLAAPTTGNGNAEIYVRNNATGGYTVTLTGFAHVIGDYNPAPLREHSFRITKSNTNVTLEIVELP